MSRKNTHPSFLVSKVSHHVALFAVVSNPGTMFERI